MTIFDGEVVVAWRCKTCGCFWRDNHDNTVSLLNSAQRSCPECEMNSTREACEGVELRVVSLPHEEPATQEIGVVALPHTHVRIQWIYSDGRIEHVTLVRRPVT